MNGRSGRSPASCPRVNSGRGVGHPQRHRSARVPAYRWQRRLECGCRSGGRRWRSGVAPSLPVRATAGKCWRQSHRDLVSSCWGRLRGTTSGHGRQAAVAGSQRERLVCARCGGAAVAARSPQVPGDTVPTDCGWQRTALPGMPAQMRSSARICDPPLARDLRWMYVALVRRGDPDTASDRLTNPISEACLMTPLSPLCKCRARGEPCPGSQARSCVSRSRTAGQRRQVRAS